MIDAILKGNNGTKSVKKHPHSPHGGCLYRTEDGNRCAVGCFIPDEVYVPTMDSDTDTSAETVIDRYDLYQYMPLDAYPMTLMQIRHDNFDDTHKVLLNWIDENVEE